MQYIVKEATTLLNALVQLAPESTRNTLRTWLKDGRVQVDDRPISDPKVLVQPGQKITIGQRLKEREGPITILYEDSHLVVIDKPENLLSVSTDFGTKPTAHGYLKKRYRPRKVFVIHRLDQDTSGVMVFALSQEAFQKLKEALKQREVKRIYYGIVEGHLDGKGTWQSYLVEDPNYVVRITTDKTKGEKAVTHYEALAHTKKYTLVRFTLETGKKNQIRVQAASNGHPIVGDVKYGAEAGPIGRLSLHAYELSFEHPILHKIQNFKAPVPPTFKALFPNFGSTW